MPAFLGRWTLGALGWAAFSAAVWFAGDAIPFLEGPFERFAVIVGAGVAWLALELAHARRSLKENEALLQGIAGGADEDSAARAAHEVSVLRKRLAEAVAVLRKARFRGVDGSRRTVAELPWYMFIGAPGSGKTTALLNAGLRFPLGDPRGERALHGVGGTRNCDWWFTDQAVLLDTAGRYTTQQSDAEADAAAWLGFLDLLKRSRPRQPLNGLIVTLSLDDLVHWNEEEMTRYASHVRERIRELYGRLRMRLPVYLLVTKADLLAGFMEFFSELDADGRAQAWGMTFASSELSTRLARSFESEFEHLERRLYALLPGRLQEERDLQRRAAIYRFPQQFRGTGPLISAFIERAFGAGWEREAPFVRGVYFTSGTQEGSPIDRVLATLARSLNLERKVQPPNVGSGKSFFLRRPLHEVVFAESGLAGVDPVEERRRRSAQALACAAIAAITIGLGAAWTLSYFGNRQLVAEAEARAVAAEAELASLHGLRPSDEARLLAALNALRGLQIPPRQGLILRAGLYQGDKLAAQAERAYHNALRDALLVHLTLSLEDALRASANREVLEGYVALHETADAKRIEQAALRIWRLPDALRPDLSAHLRAALADRPLALPRPRDDVLIDQARRKLGVRA
jgi:type VI secretion system protein ImpL